MIWAYITVCIPMAIELKGPLSYPSFKETGGDVNSIHYYLTRS